ncbi:hypothetical protein ACLB2K_066140 [Fragaria x ananassa]
MDMKKIFLALIVVAAFVSIALAKETSKTAASPKESAAPKASETHAHAPAPSNAATTMPVAGAFLLSFFAYYLQ